MKIRNPQIQEAQYIPSLSKKYMPRLHCKTSRQSLESSQRKKSVTYKEIE